jgi:hypothetical protein
MTSRQYSTSLIESRDSDLDTTRVGERVRFLLAGFRGTARCSRASFWFQILILVCLFMVQGKETEHNWIQRERAITRVRGMLVTGVHRQMQAAFISTLRSSFLSVSTKAVSRTLGGYFLRVHS